MIPISKEIKDGKITITTLTKRIFRKPKVRRFVADKEYPTGYWNWVELPHFTLVGDILSFQLDEWTKRL